MMMMWMMTRSPALFVLLSLSATTTSVTGLSVRRNSLPLGEGHQVGEWRQVITEDLDDTAMDSKAKSELLELAAKEYKGLADKASEAKEAITADDKDSLMPLPQSPDVPGHLLASGPSNQDPEAKYVEAEALDALPVAGQLEQLERHLAQLEHMTRAGGFEKFAKSKMGRGSPETKDALGTSKLIADMTAAQHGKDQFQ